MKNIRTKAISLITAALTIAACAIHASAETSYPPGDVNMNGKAEADDALLVLTEYLNFTIMKDESARTFTDEQIALGDVYHPDAQYEGIDGKDAQNVLTKKPVCGMIISEATCCFSNETERRNLYEKNSICVYCKPYVDQFILRMERCSCRNGQHTLGEISTL